MWIHVHFLHHIVDEIGLVFVDIFFSVRTVRVMLHFVVHVLRRGTTRHQMSTVQTDGIHIFGGCLPPVVIQVVCRLRGIRGAGEEPVDITR
jgi:hypothetical protein